MVASGLVFSYEVNQYASPRDVPFHSIQWGYYAKGYAHPTYLAINDQETWTRVWTQAFCDSYSCPPTPQVDFEHRTVLVVFLGQKPTSGYAVNVTQVTQQGSELHVLVTLTTPGRSCGEYEVLTFPFHFVDLPKTSMAVTFTNQTSVRNC